MKVLPMSPNGVTHVSEPNTTLPRGGTIRVHLRSSPAILSVSPQLMLGSVSSWAGDSYLFILWTRAEAFRLP